MRPSEIDAINANIDSSERLVKETARMREALPGMAKFFVVRQINRRISST